jgi:hypothetical protein
MVFSAIQTSQAPQNPFPAIFPMLVEIQKQIEQLRVEIGIRLNQIDTKLGAYISQSLALEEGELKDTRRLRPEDEATAFAPVLISSAPSTSSLPSLPGRIEIVLRCGRRVIVDNGVYSAALARVLAVLERP